MILAFTGGAQIYLTLLAWLLIQDKTRKTCPCNVYPIEPHFYIAKLGFAGVYLFFFFAPKHRLWVLVRIGRGGSNVYPQSMV